MRKVALLLVVALFVPSADAVAGALRDAAARGGRDLAAQQPASGARNPYKTGSFVMMGAGAGLLVIGLMQERGAEVGTNSTGTSISVTEKGGSKTALIAIGASALGAGAGLYAWGESKKRSVQPQIQFTRSGLTVGAAVGF